MTLQEYKTYFEQMAVDHQDIRHQEIVGNRTKNRFCVFDPEEIDSDARFNLDPNHFGLYLKTFIVKNVRDGSNLRKVYQAGYAILKACPAGDMKAKELAQSEAEQICEDIILELLNRQICQGEGFLQIGSSTRLRIDQNDEVYDAEPAALLSSSNLCGYDVNFSIYEHTDHNRRRRKFS